MNPAENSNFLESVAGAALRALLDEKSILRKFANIHDAVLTEQEVAELLGVSIATLDRMRKKDEWQMVKKEGKWRMSRKQFREQRDKWLAMKKRGF